MRNETDDKGLAPLRAGTARAPLVSSKRPAVVATVIFLAGLALSWAGYRNQAASVHKESRLAFDQKADSVSADARVRLLRPGYGLGGARAAWSASQGYLDVSEFGAYMRARDMANEFPGVHGFGIIERVRRADRLQYEARLSQAYGEAVRVRTDETSTAPSMLVIRSIEPLAANRQALGFDVGSEPLRRTAAEQAFRGGEPRLTAPIRLLQDAGRPGALYFLPVFASGSHVRQGEADAVVGLVYAAIAYPALMSGLVPATDSPLDVRLLDLNAPADQRILFSSVERETTRDRPEFSRADTLVIGGRTLQLQMASTPRFEAGFPLWRVQAAAVLTGLAGLLAALFAYQLLITRDRALRLAGEMTRDLREERSRLNGILEGTGAGTWEWNVQTGETRFNERWAEILGYRLEELAPVSIETWLKAAHPDDLKLSGEALQAHFDGLTPTYDCEARMRHRDGHWVWVLDRGKVMTRTADGKPEWMFGTHLDITKRKQLELDVQEKRALLETTFRSIGDAVVTADAAGRVLSMNPVAEILSGWTEQEAIGRLSSEVLHLEIEGFTGPVPSPIEICLRDRCKVGLASDTVLVSREGDARFAIEDSVAPLLDDGGELLGAVMVFHDVTEKRQLSREMHRRARHDSLTGLPNRDEFETHLAEAINRIAAGGRAGALMFLDLDHFKVVNDTCGHSAGDELLKQVSTLVRRSVRERDLVARFGGDEFVLLLEGCPMDRAEVVAKSICEAVDAYRYSAADGTRFRVGASVGVVCLDDRWHTISGALQAADAACYDAKSEGRNRVVVHGAVPPRSSSGAGTMQWGARIGQALDENLFELFGQRIVPLQAAAAGEGMRCEVLLRLRDGRGGYVSPAAFIPTAERYQLASRIDRWVLDALLATLRRADRTNLARINFNLSGQSVGDRQFHRHACKAIQDSGVDPTLLCVEITETAAVTNLADASAFMAELREIGVKVALDDFGSGSSSFGYLKQLPVDVLKIDGQFVRGLRTSALDEAAVRCFIDVAQVLAIKTVAEQVEDAATADALRKLGVGYAQGYHYHRPESLEKLLVLKSGPVGIVQGGVA